MTHKADFWFDPTCPWAWMTSRWMLEVTKLRDIEVSWHLLSLAVLNEGRDLDPEYMAHMEEAKLPARVIAAVEQTEGADLVEPIYTAMGTRFHPGNNKTREAIAEALDEVGLDPALIERAESGEFDEAMRASTQAALDLVGDDVGVPVIAIDGTAFFGPVVTPAPTGEAAAQLWDGAVAVASTPGFFELKRTRTQGPIFE
ncbi:MAG: DsbA family protein [Flaviflexus sp.]|nr:DsbA family protein [Flaviflexus sp.]